MTALLLTVLFAPYYPLPPLEVAKCLPSKAYAEAHIEFAHRVLKGYNGGPVTDVANWNLYYWRQVVWIQDASLVALQRRRYLGELIDWLGWEAVLTGRIPPAMPLDLIPDRP